MKAADLPPPSHFRTQPLPASSGESSDAVIRNPPSPNVLVRPRRRGRHRGDRALGGGYLPTAWGWAIAGPAAVVLAALLLRSEVRVSRASAGFLLLLTALVAWTAASSLWTDSVRAPSTSWSATSSTWRRSGRSSSSQQPGGDRRRRADRSVRHVRRRARDAAASRTVRAGHGDGVPARAPIGYWNGLGLLAAVGALLALGMVADARRRWARSAAAAALVVLLAAMFATLSRGAWLALAGRPRFALALHPDRGGSPSRARQPSRPPPRAWRCSRARRS